MVQEPFLISRYLHTPLLEHQMQYRAPSQTVTFSEVVLKKPEGLVSSEIKCERDGLTMFSMES